MLPEQRRCPELLKCLGVAGDVWLAGQADSARQAGQVHGTEAWHRGEPQDRRRTARWRHAPGWQDIDNSPFTDGGKRAKLVAHYLGIAVCLA